MAIPKYASHEVIDPWRRSLCLLVCWYVGMLVCRYVGLSGCLSVCRSVDLSTCLYVYMSAVCLSVDGCRLPFCLSIN